MTNQRAIELLKIEKECIRRNGGPACKRTVIPAEGCFGCDLVQNDAELLAAYDVAIAALATMPLAPDAEAFKEGYIRASIDAFNKKE